MSPQSLNNNQRTGDNWIDKVVFTGQANAKQRNIGNKSTYREGSEQERKNEHVAVRPKSSPGDLEHRNNVAKFGSFGEYRDSSSKEPYNKSNANNQSNMRITLCKIFLNLGTHKGNSLTEVPD